MPQLLNVLGVHFLIIACAATAFAQTRSYPKEIRGYKVERTVVELKKSGNRQSTSDSDVDSLIKFGEPQLARVTPLGITFQIPIVVAPVEQKGRIDFLTFEDMIVNGTPVEI